MNKSTATSGVYVELAQLLALRHLASTIDITAAIKKQATLSGLHITRARGRGMDFDEVRIYQPGDDARSIDWRVTARTQVTHTKLYREERERPVMILADQSASLFFGSRHCFKSVLVARLAALIAWSTLFHGDRIGGMVFGNDQHQEIRPRRHKQAVLHLINALVTANHELNKHRMQNQNGYLLTALTKIRHTLKSGGRLIMLSDFSHYDDACYRELYKIAQHNQVIALLVYDPLEKELPNSGWYTVSNQTEHTRINANNSQLRLAYHQQFEKNIAVLKNDFLRCNIPLLEISTADDLIKTIGRPLSAKTTGRYAVYG
jgi:uncharacterized protein (DUF58 family)